LTQCSIITLEKNSIKNKTQKQFESTRVNSLSIIPDSWDQNKIIESKQIKS
jgi:hypothetical protein